MSQYLSHLANLAFNHVDVVQPRLASRFENQDAPLAPNPVEQDTIQSARAVPQPHEHIEQAPNTNFSRPLQSNIQPLVENIYPTEIRVQEIPAMKPAQAQDAINQVTPTKLPVAKTPPPAIMATNTIVERHFEQVSVPTPSIKLEEIRIPNAKHEHLEPTVIKEPAKYLPVKEDKPEPRIIEKREATSDPVKPTSIRVQQVQIEPITAPAVNYSNIPRAEVDVTPTPTIHVSIGRIEIRASQTSSPAPTKSRASNGMSLDDYLKQRNGDKP
jgi:hypothetical protein